MAALTARSPLPHEMSIRSSSRNFSVSPAPSDSQSQLDEIITDLLSDKALMKDTGEFDPVQLNGVVMPQHGSITTQSGNSRTVLSWQTHQAGPTRSISVSSQSISRPSSNARVESDNIRQHSHSVQRLPAGGSSLTDEERWAASERYLYSSKNETRASESKSESNKRSKVFSTAPLTKSITEPVSTSPPPPPVRRRMFSPDQLSSSEYNDASYRSPPNRGGRVDDKISTSSYKRSMSETRPYASDSEDALGSSWLDTQRAKLQGLKDGTVRSETQQRVTKSYTTNRSYQTVQSDTEDSRVIGRGGRHGAEPPARPPPPVCSYDSLDELNNLLSESSRELTLTRERQLQQQLKQEKQQQHPRSSSVGARHNNYESQPCFFVSGIERPAYSKQQTKYVFSVSPSPSSMLRDDSLEESWNKPPTCTSPQAPRRGDSSKKAVQRRNDDKAPIVSVDELDQTLAKLLASDRQTPGSEWMTEKIIEEEIISLEPIGRGIQTLEPDTSTLPKVRSRAVSPVYPGFPVPGYRSPSLGRMMQPASPVPGFKTPTPAPAQLSPTTPVSTLPSAAPPTFPSSTPTPGAKSSTVLSKEEDLEQAINAMLADTMPYNTTQSSTALKESKTTAFDTKKTSSTMQQEKQTFQQTQQQQQQQQQSGGQPRGGVVQTTVTKTYSSTSSGAAPSGSTVVMERGPSPALLEAQQQVHKQQHLLLQQSQQIQQLRQQQEQLRQKQVKLDQQTTAAQQLQQQQQQQPGWVVQEQTTERTFSRGPQATLTQSSATTSQQQTQQQHVQQQQTQHHHQTAEESVDIQQLLNSLSDQYPHQQNSAWKVQTETESTYSVPSKGPLSAGYAASSSAATSGSRVAVQQSSKNAMHTHGVQCGSSCSAQKQQSSALESASGDQQQQQHGWKVETAVGKTVESSATKPVAFQGTAAASSSPFSASSASQGQNISGQQNYSSESKEYSTVTEYQQRQKAVTTSASAAQSKNKIIAGETSAAHVSGAHHSGSTQMNHQEEYQEQHYATVPLKENRLNAYNVESTEGGETLSDRATSPSHWTTDTLRSYTARMHSGSASPLFQPGSTLPPQGRASPSPYFGNSRTGSVSSINENDVTTLRFVKDTSKYWHKPNISREEAIHILRDKPPGSFIVRNSSTFQGAYGLALKVAQIPSHVQSKGGDPQTELVRHFLIEPTAKGVRLKGCSNEPVFGSLAALVYQHTLTPLALPCKLLLPEDTEVKFLDVTDGNTSALSHGAAACNVLYVNSVDTESLTGPAALSKAMQKTFGNNRQPKTALVQFKVTNQGITLTDHKRSVFFRRHYPMSTVTYCGIDEGERRWTPNKEDSAAIAGRVFGFVARKPGSLSDNACHLFVESDPGQPATAIVDFITKIMIGQGQFMKT